MSVTPAQIEAGQAVYTKRMLGVYDLLVLKVSNHLVWRCPTLRLLAHYNGHITSNHLDVGVGTGYFLDRCHFPSPSPRVGLMDLNQNSIDFAAGRIARYQPETFRRDVLKPLGEPSQKFDSLGLNYLLHCLPGTIESKSVIFDHLAEWLNPEAVVFGSTLLSHGVTHSWTARRLMAFYNKKGVFSNQSDSLDGLRRELDQRFQDVVVEAAGCAAIFSARR